MLSWTRLILICLMFNVGETETIEPGEIAQEITEHFEKLANITVDSNEMYYVIEETPNVFQKLFSGMNVFTNVTLEPQSEEFKALKKINDTVYRHLEIAKIKELEYSGFSVVGEEMTYEYDEYKWNFGYTFMDFLKGLPVILNATKRESRENLLFWCGGFNSRTLSRITMYLSNALTKNCEESSTRVYVKLERIFMTLDDKFKHYSDTEGQTNIKLVYSTYESALEKLYLMTMTKQWRFGSGCFLDSVFNNNLFDRRAIAKFTEMVKLTLVRLMVTTSVCSNINYPNNSEARKAYVKEIEGDVQHIAYFFSDYIPKKIMGLHDAEMFMVEKMINEFPVYYSKQNTSYASLANNIDEALKYTSGETTERRILIAPSENRNSSITTFFGCPTDRCTMIKGKRGVDVMLSRKSSHTDIALDRVKYTYSDKSRIIDILRTNYYKPLSRLVNEFKYKWILPEHSAVIRH